MRRSQCGKQVITNRYLIQVGKYCAFIWTALPCGEVCVQLVWQTAHHKALSNQDEYSKFTSSQPGGEVRVQSVWQTAHHQALSNSGMEALYCIVIHRGSTRRGSSCAVYVASSPITKCCLIQGDMYCTFRQKSTRKWSFCVVDVASSCSGWCSVWYHTIFLHGPSRLHEGKICVQLLKQTFHNRELLFVYFV